MLKQLFLALVLSASIAPFAQAQEGFDLSGYQSGAGPTLQGPNAQSNFNASGDPLQWQNPANWQAAPQTPIGGSIDSQQAMQAQLQAQNAAQVQANQAAQLAPGGGAAASGGTTGDFYRMSNPTGTGPQGVGGLTTAKTWQQTPVSLQTGTMGLAPVFGYGGGSGGLQSPGGYVSVIQLPFGLGSFRVPPTIGLPGGGAIGLPQINGSTINNTLNGILGN